MSHQTCLVVFALFGRIRFGKHRVLGICVRCARPINITTLR